MLVDQLVPPLYVSGCGQATRPVTLVEVFTVTGKINLLGQILSTRSISLSPCSQILSPARQNIVQKLYPCSQILSPHVKRRVTLTFNLCCLLRSSAFVYVRMAILNGSRRDLVRTELLQNSCSRWSQMRKWLRLERFIWHFYFARPVMWSSVLQACNVKRLFSSDRFILPLLPLLLGLFVHSSLDKLKCSWFN